MKNAKVTLEGHHILKIVLAVATCTSSNEESAKVAKVMWDALWETEQNHEGALSCFLKTFMEKVTGEPELNKRVDNLVEFLISTGELTPMEPAMRTRGGECDG